MPRRDYKRCKGCGRHASEVGPLSRTRQCVECGDARLTENVLGLHRHTGRALERWRYHVASSVLEPDAIFALVAAGYLEPQD